MPVAYTIDRVAAVVVSRAAGNLTDADLLEHQRRLSQDPAFTPDLNQLFTFQDVTDVEVSGDGIRALAQRNPLGAGSRRAFTVEPGATAVFGLMRMFQILTADHPDELRVQFDDLGEARQWVGLPTGGG